MKKLILLVVFPAFIFATSAENIISKVCSECHGSKMAESCMGVSKFPNSLSQSEILIALKGYRDGKRSEYGMGSTMTEKVSGFSNDELEELSKHIPTLK
jgi:cytochrome c553